MSRHPRWPRQVGLVQSGVSNCDIKIFQFWFWIQIWRKVILQSRMKFVTETKTKLFMGKVNEIRINQLPVSATRGQCYKNTINYRGKKTLLFLGLKYRGNLLSHCSYLLSFQGKFNVVKIPLVIYLHSTVYTKVMLLYNTEWWYDHGMVVNYHGKKFYNIGPRCQLHQHFMSSFCEIILLPKNYKPKL